MYLILSKEKKDVCIFGDGNDVHVHDDAQDLSRLKISRITFYCKNTAESREVFRFCFGFCKGG